MISMNHMNVIRNPYQGEAKKVLCVCSAGVLRSPTAAATIHEVYGHNTRSAGVSDDFALIPVTDNLCYWADEIVIMESWMETMEVFEPYQDKLICLNIPDMFPYMALELVELIKERYDECSNG
jgi:predicted protein tyrosine phosphatase